MQHPTLDPDLAVALSDPGAGGVPGKLLDAAGELVRAANHATIRWSGHADGMASGADAYDTAGALERLVMRLPQLCRQLATILEVAAGDHTTLTVDPGHPAAAPTYAARELRDAAETLTAAATPLHTTVQLLAGVGGFLSAEAAARASAEHYCWEERWWNDNLDRWECYICGAVEPEVD
jgi:hypothetical protein